MIQSSLQQNIIPALLITKADYFLAFDGQVFEHGRLIFHVFGMGSMYPSKQQRLAIG